MTAAEAGGRHWQRSQVDERSRQYNYREYEAQQRLQQQRRPIYRQHRRNNNDGVALGIIGLGVGAIIGGAIANSHNNPRVTYEQPRVRNQARTASGGRYEPWSNSWLRYCSDKYRSFNASTGTYRGYDGRDHFCVVN
ncbi:BA14K family protein [Hoeflea sp. G2-23]|uniref:Lectin-like protein BA14k n=1 Tax=Hoeflea algicola TaxID=2983763 RepID=A0ABT3Z8D7_9HYPH|nr:BA14K family protein [Hoeflea algicola]MCY0147989.1 BA14K family protein [Hoeflea algicola]